MLLSEAGLTFVNQVIFIKIIHEYLFSNIFEIVGNIETGPYFEGSDFESHLKTGKTLAYVN